MLYGRGYRSTSKLSFDAREFCALGCMLCSSEAHAISINCPRVCSIQFAREMPRLKQEGSGSKASKSWTPRLFLSTLMESPFSAASLPVLTQAMPVIAAKDVIIEVLIHVQSRILQLSNK